MGTQDFDFWFGSWTTRHRQLKRRLAGCTDWAEFGGSCTVQPLLGGAGNLDDNIIEHPNGTYRAVTLRSFDPKSESWAIWWLDGRNPHVLDVPMIGSFAGGVGTFHCNDAFEGRAIRVRFLWSDITERSCRWQQAFSEDGGSTWETNWIMDFTRQA